jgi:hypothetical protein
MAGASPREVERIGAIGSPVIRNLEITYAYSQLATALERRCGQGANWCAFATWASRQAGRTIRGEDMVEYLQQRLGRDAELLHPLRSLGRMLLRAGLFDPESRLGKLLGRLHTPLDAFEAASDAVARGNRKVFVEIGAEFARYLATPDFQAFLDGLKPGEPPDGQRLLRQAFVRYEQLRTESDPVARAQLALLANLEIGMHEQTRLQPEIREAMDAPYVTAQELGARLFPWLKRPRSRTLAGKLARPAQAPLAELARAAITHAFMVLSLPGRVLALGADLDAPIPEVLRSLTNPELEALVALYEPAAAGVDHSGAHDWSDLHQRMHYIVHLFRAFHESADLFRAPFTTEEIERFTAGVVPEGDL